MAVEQLLADVKAPHINGAAAARILANEVLKNIVQGQIEGDKRGVTLGFSQNTNGAQIRILRVLPLEQDARELGANVNGNNFSGKKEQPRTTEVGIDVITTIDTPIDIANVTEDMIPVGLLSKVMDNFGDTVNININAMTMAEKLAATYKGADKNVQEVQQTVRESIQEGILKANAKLDDGDWENGVAIFPEDDRVGVIRPSFRPILLTRGILIVGGSNYAQELLAKGVLSPGARAVKLQNGYVGDIDGVPFHIASNLLWDTAAKYLGLPKGEFNNVYGYISSGIGTGRAVAANSQMKIIDSPDGQGLRLQPLVRMGVKCWYPKSTVVLTEKGAESPLDFIEELKPESVKVKAPGSRVVPEMKVTGSDGANATVTVTSGKYDNGQEIGIIAGSRQYIISTENAAPTIENFVKLKKTAEHSGTYTSGSPISQSQSGKAYLYAVAVDNMGTANVVKYLYKK